MDKPELDSPVNSSWLGVLPDPARLSLLHALAELGAATANELAVSTHSSDASVHRHLEAMVRQGVVDERRGQSDGVTPGRPPSRFALHPDVSERVSALFAVLKEPLTPQAHTSARRRREPRLG